MGGGTKWIALGILCLVLAGIAQLATRRAVRYHRRLKTWRWDDIAKWKQGMGIIERSLIAVGRTAGWLPIPLALIGLASIAVGASTTWS